VGIERDVPLLTELRFSLPANSINIASLRDLGIRSPCCSLNTLFHECKLLIKKEMIKRRSGVHSAGSIATTKSCDNRGSDLHKVLHRFCGSQTCADKNPGWQTRLSRSGTISARATTCQERNKPAWENLTYTRWFSFMVTVRALRYSASCSSHSPTNSNAF